MGYGGRISASGKSGLGVEVLTGKAKALISFQVFYKRLKSLHVFGRRGPLSQGGLSNLRGQHYYGRFLYPRGFNRTVLGPHVRSVPFRSEFTPFDKGPLLGTTRGCVGENLFWGEVSQFLQRGLGRNTKQGSGLSFLKPRLWLGTHDSIFKGAKSHFECVQQSAGVRANHWGERPYISGALFSLGHHLWLSDLLYKAGAQQSRFYWGVKTRPYIC